MRRFHSFVPWRRGAASLLAASLAPHSQSHSVLTCHLPVCLFITTAAARLIDKNTILNLPAWRRMMTHISISTPLPPQLYAKMCFADSPLPNTLTHTHTHKQPRWRPNECQVQVTLTFLIWQNMGGWRAKRWWQSTPQSENRFSEGFFFFNFNQNFPFTFHHK